MIVSKTEGGGRANPYQSISAENYKFLQQEVYRESGIVVDADKHYLLEARLTPILRSAGLPSLDALCAAMRQGVVTGLTKQVMEALTTNETLFFRDNAPFEATRLHLLPGFQASLGVQEHLKIWSAAASSGQEAYSLAMLMREHANPARQFSILGTDISEKILSVARKAQYAQFEVDRGLPPAYLVKYFKRVDTTWQLTDEIRAAVTFRQFDLRRSMIPLGRFHIIFCRNVLIYFDMETKVKILTQLWEALENGGFLILGNAESAPQTQDLFERVLLNGASLYRKR